MRVTHVYKDVHPPICGGIEKHIALLRKSMPSVTTDVLVCARDRTTTVEHVGTGMEVRVGQLGRLLSSPVAPTFPLWLRRAEADVIHMHMPNPLGELSALTALGDRPYVVSYHADIVRQAWLMPVYRPLVQASLAGARRIVVGSEAMRGTPALRAHAANVEVVPYGVDTDRYCPDLIRDDERAAVLQRYGRPLVVAVGRLVYYKGFEHLIGAAAHLEASVVVVGAGRLGDRLAQLARGQPRVHLAGEATEEQLLALLSAADVFVLPSVNHAESVGIATIEAQSMGVPAVVTDVGTGTTEAIEPGATGLVVQPGSPRALADAIGALLDDPNRREAMGRAARERVLRRHSARVQATSMQRIYEEVADAGSASRVR